MTDEPRIPRNYVVPAIQQLISLGKDTFASDLPGISQVFDAPYWDIRMLKYSSIRNGSENRVYFTRYGTKHDPLPQVYAEVIKSWVLLERQSLSNMLHRVAAARVLWEAVLLRRGGIIEAFTWEELCEEDFSQAETFMLERKWAPTTIYKQVLRLVSLSNFLAARKICRPLYYVLQTPHPEDFHRHTIAGQQERMKKLPAMRAIEGLADIYANRAEEPRDKLRLAALAILTVTGLRIGELLTLPEDCEVREMRRGKAAYGLRYYVEKTRGGVKATDIRWLTPIGAELVQKAVAEIKEITSAARERARVLEQSSDRVPIPGFSSNERMSPKQVTQVLGLENRTSVHRVSRDRLPIYYDENGAFYRVSEVEAYLLTERVDVLWTLDRKDGTHQFLSESLFIAFRYFLHSYKGTNPLLVEPMGFDNLSEFLSRTGRSYSVFERFDIREEDGSFCRMTSHQFRHWLNDIADKVVYLSSCRHDGWAVSTSKTRGPISIQR